MIERNRKLPQSRYYLQVANYGIESLVALKPMNEGFLFFSVGILASLRAVQHALLKHDRTLSPRHKEVIEAWKRSTPMDGPEITFIKTSRDHILKTGAFNAYAGPRQGGTFEGEHFKVTREIYDTGYYVGEERRDLIADMRSAAEWCNKELTAIEAEVPAVDLPGDMAE
ncbi:MAG TPA: hypothetical protein VKT99_09125 [Xanthobacteraceae bacterium]|jgi:hypothetical protein|nr:hypothetical protein [Xanthobacteraceae bacterium]